MSFCCFGEQLTLQPDEPRAALQLVVGLLIVEVGQDRRNLLERLISVHDAARLRKERGRFDIRCEHFAVAVNDVGP